MLETLGNTGNHVATACDMKPGVIHRLVAANTLNSFEKFLAGEPGLEPRLTESESVVLPLNYSPAVAAEAWLGCCAALITKTTPNANTRFEKIRSLHGG